MVIPFLNILKSINNHPLLVRLYLVTQPLVVMLGEKSQPLWFMLKTIRQPLWVMLTPLKRLTIQNTSPNFLVTFVRETTLFINALLSWRSEEFGFMVIPFFNILNFFNNQPLLASVVYAERKRPATASHVDTIEKTGHSKCKLKFPCKLYEGDHLTH